MFYNLYNNLQVRVIWFNSEFQDIFSVDNNVWWQVPVPISENKSYFTGMKWLIVAGRDRPHRKVHFPENLAAELIDAHKNKVSEMTYYLNYGV